MATDNIIPGSLRTELYRVLGLLLLASVMFVPSRGMQMALSLLYSTLLPVLVIVAALILYFRSPLAAAPVTRRGPVAALFLLAFVTTVGFWTLSLAAIEYHTPVGDTGGMLFMITLMPTAFIFWWPGLAVALGRNPLAGGERGPARASCLARGLTGVAGGLPLYIVAVNRGWDDTVLIPF